MRDKAYLILANGLAFEGRAFGKRGEAIGEIVFSTGMGGYLETLTDPSFYGQFILQTFPLIGNYGIIPEDFESDNIAATAYIAKYPCDTPSNFRAREMTLDTFLQERGVIGLCDIDTRELTRVIRQSGVMGAKITQNPPTDRDRAEAEAFRITGAVEHVSPKGSEVLKQTGDKNIALINYGAKRGIAQALMDKGCRVTSFAHNTSAQEILKINPDGIMLSNGPGDPADPINAVCVDTLKDIIRERPELPIFGICLGHQLLAIAHGHKTQKLKFGHRGANQPAKDTKTGQVYITSQNHGYTVIADNASYINVNDGTCEGMDYGVSFSVQFHPEARSGPYDTAFLFDDFIKRMERG